MPDDLANLGELFQRYREPLLRMLRRRIPASLTARIDPEDVLQEAFHLARRRYARFRAQTALGAYPWLYGVVRDCYLKQWHRHTRGCRNHLQDGPWPERSSLQLGLGLIARGGTPSESAADAEVRRRVLRAVQRLPEDDREVLAMRYWEGFAFREIGAVLGLSTEAARVRHARALLRFQELWQGLPHNNRLPEGGPRKEPAS